MGKNGIIGTQIAKLFQITNEEYMNNRKESHAPESYFQQIRDKLDNLNKANPTLAEYKIAVLQRIENDLKERSAFQSGLLGEAAMVQSRILLTNQLALLKQGNSPEENKEIIKEINKTKMEYEEVRCFYEKNILPAQDINDYMENEELAAFKAIKTRAEGLLTQQNAYKNICKDLYQLALKEIELHENIFKSTMVIVKRLGVKALCDEQLKNYRDINNIYKKKMAEFNGEIILDAQPTDDNSASFMPTIDAPSTSASYADNPNVTFSNRSKAKEAKQNDSTKGNKKSCNIS